MSNLDSYLDPPPATLITQPNGSPDLLPRPTTSSLSWPTYASKIAPANLPHSVLVMPGKPAVFFSDLTSDLVYPAALVPHAFSPGRGVSYAWQNRMPPCTNLAHRDRKDFFYSYANVSPDLASPPIHPHHHCLPILTTTAYASSPHTHPSSPCNYPQC